MPRTAGRCRTMGKRTACFLASRKPVRGRCRERCSSRIAHSHCRRRSSRPSLRPAGAGFDPLERRDRSSAHTQDWTSVFRDAITASRIVRSSPHEFGHFVFSLETLLGDNSQGLFRGVCTSKSLVSSDLHFGSYLIVLTNGTPECQGGTLRRNFDLAGYPECLSSLASSERASDARRRLCRLRRTAPRNR